MLARHSYVCHYITAVFHDQALMIQTWTTSMSSTSLRMASRAAALELADSLEAISPCFKASQSIFHCKKLPHVSVLCVPSLSTVSLVDLFDAGMKGRLGEVGFLECLKAQLARAQVPLTRSK